LLKKKSKKGNDMSINMKRRTSTLPGTASTLPGTASTLPGTASTLPGTASTLPGTASTLPGTASTLPGTASTLPGTASTAANESSDYEEEQQDEQQEEQQDEEEEPQRKKTRRRSFEPRDYTRGEQELFTKVAAKFRGNKVRATRRKGVLQAVCRDSNYCFLFQENTESLKKYFYDFNFLTHLVRAKKLESEDEKTGINGYLYHLRFERDQYRADAIMKNARTESNDNLFYEFLVGLYVNSLLTTFPCFVETYNLFRFKGVRERNSAQSARNLATFFRKNLSVSHNMDLDQACREPLLTCLLVQYVPNPLNIMDLRPEDLDLNIWGILMQIYFPLASLEGEFSHMDLHWNNVLLYETNNGEFVTYHFHFEGTTVAINCQYLVKIIDYGRCFIPSFNETREAVRLNANCRQKGFSWYAVTPDRYENSVDLRPLVLLKNHFAVPELEGISFFPDPSARVNSVTDALMFVADVIQHKTFNFTGKPKFGDMHIYTDRDFQFFKRRI